MSKPTFTHCGTTYPPITEIEAKAKSHEDSAKYELAYLAGSLITKYEMCRIDLYNQIQEVQRLNQIIADMSLQIKEFETLELTQI